MSKNLLQDMIRVRKPTVSTIDSLEVKDRKYNEKNIPTKGKRGIYLVTIISVVFLFFALSIFFNGAKVTIFPKSKEINLKGTMSATKENDAGLSFNLMIISGEEEKEIEGGALQDIAVPATGRVIIYNNFSSASQNLDIETRLLGSNGKIYKTDKKITVPGMKNNLPGSVEVGIHASVSGSEYNSTPMDFKIFGFKGTSKYDKFYARSKGDISGGFSGKSSTVSSLEKKATSEDLKLTLKERLFNRAKEQVPSGFVLFEGATIFDVLDSDISFTSSTNSDKVVAKVKGTLYGFIFNEKEVSVQIAEDTVDGYKGEDLYIEDINGIKFSLSGRDGNALSEISNINFSLSGRANLIWRIDESKFIADIKGKNKKEFNDVMSNYYNIASAQLRIRPFWKNSIPEDSKKINVIVNYSNNEI